MMNHKNYIIIVIILAGLILITPYGIRILEGNPYIINSETYHNILVYESLDTGPINLINLLHIKQDFILFRILPVLLGLGSIILTYSILNKHNMSWKAIIASLVVLIISPVFIYTFIDLKMQGVTLFLTLLCIYLMSLKKPVLGLLIFTLAPFIDIYSSVIGAVAIIAYLLLTQGNKKYNNIWISYLLIINIISIIANYVMGFNILQNIQISQGNILVEIGANVGYSFSGLLLSLIGIIMLWEKGLKNMIINVSILVLIVLSSFYVPLKTYINIVLVVFSGFAFIYLTRRKWSIQIIKKITLLLIICSIIFTSILYVTNLTQADPNPEYVDAMTFIKDQGKTNEIILNYDDNGNMIKYYSTMTPYISDTTTIEGKNRMLKLDNISSVRTLTITDNFLNQSNIKYVFVDPKFGQFLEEKEGLLFLINTSNEFKSIYKNEEIEVWLYTG